MRKTVIWSWPQAQTETLPYPYAHISIGALCCVNPHEPLSADPNRLAVLNVDFHDHHSTAMEGHPDFTPEQAAEVVAFVLEWTDKVEGFAVNCWGGVSRSAGIAAGIAPILGLQAEPYDDKPYNPNPRARDLVLAASAK